MENTGKINQLIVFEKCVRKYNTSETEERQILEEHCRGGV